MGDGDIDKLRKMLKKALPSSKQLNPINPRREEYPQGEREDAAAQAYNVEASMSEIYSAERRISDVKGLGLTEGSFKSMATLPPVKAPAKASPRMAGVQPLDRYATTTFQDDDMDHLTPRSRAKAEKEREKMLNELQADLIRYTVRGSKPPTNATSPQKGPTMSNTLSRQQSTKSPVPQPSMVPQPPSSFAQSPAARPGYMSGAGGTGYLIPLQ